MQQHLTKPEIDSVCIGYSGESHWEFFKTVLANPEIKTICVLGVYYGRDLAYISAILNSYGREDYLLVGVDKFEDSFCEDWPEEKKGLTWQEAGFGPAPTLLQAKTNLMQLNLDDNVVIIQELDAEFLKNTQQKFDFIYIDTSHDYQSVKDLIKLALNRLNPNGIMGGDDFSDAGTWGVERAVKESFREFNVYFDWLWLAHPKNH